MWAGITLSSWPPTTSAGCSVSGRIGRLSKSKQSLEDTHRPFGVSGGRGAAVRSFVFLHRLRTVGVLDTAHARSSYLHPLRASLIQCSTATRVWGPVR